MPRIAVVGSANMDLVVTCGALPRPGQTVFGSRFETHPGGKGANQAVAAARMAAPGSEVFFVGCVGSDENGGALRRSLSEAGVRLDHLVEDAAADTGTAHISVDESGENTIVVVAGANALVSAETVTSALAAIKPDIVLVQLEIPDGAVYAASGHGRLVLDPAPATQLDPEFLSRVEVVTPNESEAHALTGIAPLDEFAQQRAAHALLEKGVRSVVLKLGEQGCYYTDGRTELRVPAPRVEPVDTTGAGDAFNGALGALLAEGRPIQEALEVATRAASLATTRHGAQPSMPTRDEV